MRKIIVTEWISLDGYTSGPNGEMDYLSFDARMGKYESDIVDQADTLLLGKTTYDSFAGSWPKVPDKEGVSEEEKDYARRLNAMRKIVISKSMDKADWESSEVWNEIDEAKIKELKEQEGKDILIYGSASIISQLTDMKLIDEYQILVQPALLSGGLKLFGEIKNRLDLELVSSEQFDSGVMLLIYKLKS